MDTFEVLADPTRRQIVEMLGEGECIAGELGESFTISQPAVSRHLRVLRDSGLVTSRGEAQRRIYRLDPAPLAQIDRWLDRYRSLWVDCQDRVEEHHSMTKPSAETSDYPPNSPVNFIRWRRQRSSSRARSRLYPRRGLARAH